MKRILIRSGAFLLLIVISLMLFYSGKGHSLLLDNKNIEINGVEYTALNMAEIQIDRLDSREILKRDRLKEDVAGQKHKITISYLDKGVQKEIQKTFTIKVGEAMYLLSIPALIGEDENWIQVFEPLN